MKYFIVRGGLREHATEYETMIFLDEIGQGSIHGHHRDPWCSSLAVMVPVVAPLSKTVTTQTRALSTTPFTARGEVHEPCNAPWRKALSRLKLKLFSLDIVVSIYFIPTVIYFFIELKDKFI